MNSIDEEDMEKKADKEYPEWIDFSGLEMCRILTKW